MEEDLLVSRGSGVTVKADGSVSGFLVRFGSPETADTDGEFFTKSTDFGFEGREEIPTRILYHHGQDPTIGLTTIGRGVVKMTDDGVWFEGQLDRRKKYVGKYVKRILQLAAMKDENELPVLGMSSGTAAHLVTYRKAAKGTREIVTWPLGLDASLTPTPADCRTYVTALKSARAVPTLEELATRHGVKADDEDDIDLADGEGLDKPRRHKGLFVALYPPADVAERLALEGGEPVDELHVTLAYCGDVDTLGALAVAQAVVNCGEVARQVSQLSGTFSGVGRFSASATSDGRDVIYAAVDVPGLAGLRERVARYLSYAGCPPRGDHGWTPHMTLSYVDPTEDSPITRLEPVSVQFSELVIVYGDTRIAIPLGASAAALDWAKSGPASLKSALDEALRASEARRRFWDLQSAFEEKLREIGQEVEDGEAKDARASVAELVADYAGKILGCALEMVGLGADDESAKSLKGLGLRAGLSLPDETTAVLAANEGLTSRIKALAERVLDDVANGLKAAMSGSRRTRIAQARDSMRAHAAAITSCADTLDAVLKETEPKPKQAAEGTSPVKATRLELLRLRIRAGRSRSAA
jgi:2'-5' RNA ligase